jgi:hypothetical protein
MPIDAASWYIPRPGDPSLYQGDVVAGVPVVLMPPASGRPWAILKPSPPTTRDQALAGNLPKNFYPRPKEPDPEVWSNHEELVLAKGIKTRIIILTQSCDIDRRHYLQVAPIYDAAGMTELKLASLRTQDIFYMFYLPADGADFPESYADLTQIGSVHKSYFKGAVPMKKLSATATTALQAHLADYFGRPFGFNTRDLVPEAGSYACVNCFHTSLTIQTLPQVAGIPFKACAGCGEDAMWLKLP